MKIFKMTLCEPATDELKRYLLPDLQIRFQLIIRFRFGIFTRDDGFPKFPFLKKKTGYGYEVQAIENDRQRGYEKVSDTFLSDYGKAELNLKCMWTPCYTVWQS